MNYTTVFIKYCLLFFGLTSPYLIWGEVIAPHRQYLELGIINPDSKSVYIENRKFSDFTNGYIPEISEHLKGARSGWLTLWTNKNELGRPVYQISGFSPAYMPSWLISQVTTSPWRFISFLALSTCFLSGLFILLFSREIGLHPIAGLIAGTSLSTSPLFMYWLTFPMFPAVWCWSAGALWAVTRLAKCPDLLGWSILAFSSYSLLMTAYPQPAVFHAYLLGGYGLCLAYQQLLINRISLIKFVALSTSAMIVGTSLAFPVYRDLAILASESARVAPDPSFFTVVLPKFASFTEVVRFLVLGTVPELFGNPITTTFPFSYDGLSVTLIVIFSAVAGLLTALKKTWGWWLAILVLCLLAFIHPLYTLGVKYLGFNLSRSTPLGSIMLPLTIIAAFGIDALAKRAHSHKFTNIVLIGGLITLGLITIGVAYGVSQHVTIRWGLLAGMLLVIGLLFAQYDKCRPFLLMVALASIMVITSYPLMLRQDPAQIAMTSPLIEKIRENLPPGTRYAVSAPGISELPPNLNAALGLTSIHSYNSLSPRRYHFLIKALGGEVETYGRWNGSVSPDFDSSMFWMSNISLILSPNTIIHDNLKYLGSESGIHFYKVISRMGDCLQLLSLQQEMNSDSLRIADPRLLPTHSPVKIMDKGDILEFEVIPGTSSVLILSQKFHRDWHARILVKQGWVITQTTEVNGVFLGTLLPPDARRVRLEFKPYVRYAWVAHVFWLLLVCVIGFQAWQKKYYIGIIGEPKYERK